MNRNLKEKVPDDMRPREQQEDKKNGKGKKKKMFSARGRRVKGTHPASSLPSLPPRDGVTPQLGRKKPHEGSPWSVLKVRS
ncbi:hypothetical protein CEXT_415131 [Caerostris extrusa]|uniref:Uncharacterized protein n=1 Tax=Caerostris extrusa TaxID=172846 RepID=A0AAV4NVB2_CAEEX|nr:hypothetical protein CEXT_415131 [Caerostris extrusa]